MRLQDGFLLSLACRTNKGFYFLTSSFQLAFRKQGLNQASLTYMKGWESCHKSGEGDLNMPVTETVGFLARLQKYNRIQIPVEVRWRYKLEPGELLKVSVQPVGGLFAGDEEFIARLMRGGRITIPWEVVWHFELNKPGCMLRVRLEPK